MNYNDRNSFERLVWNIGTILVASIITSTIFSVYEYYFLYSPSSGDDFTLTFPTSLYFGVGGGITTAILFSISFLVTIGNKKVNPYLLATTSSIYFIIHFLWLVDLADNIGVIGIQNWIVFFTSGVIVSLIFFRTPLQNFF